ADHPQLDRVLVEPLLLEGGIEVERIDEPLQEGAHDRGLLLHGGVHAVSFLLVVSVDALHPCGRPIPAAATPRTAPRAGLAAVGPFRAGPAPLARAGRSLGGSALLTGLARSLRASPPPVAALGLRPGAGRPHARPDAGLTSGAPEQPGARLF